MWAYTHIKKEEKGVEERGERRVGKGRGKELCFLQLTEIKILTVGLRLLAVEARVNR